MKKEIRTPDFRICFYTYKTEGDVGYRYSVSIKPKRGVKLPPWNRVGSGYPTEEEAVLAMEKAASGFTPRVKPDAH
jgi:hypothetical protein